MIEFEIIPHIGIGPIRLGMKRNEVHNILGIPEHTSPDKSREGYLKGFMVDYNDSDKVEFIEIAKSYNFKGMFEGKCLLDLPAIEALNHVCKFGKYDSNDPEIGHSYTFVELQMALWRGTPPEDIQDNNRNHFESISIGEEGYFKYNNNSKSN